MIPGAFHCLDRRLRRFTLSLKLGVLLNFKTDSLSLNEGEGCHQISRPNKEQDMVVICEACGKMYRVDPHTLHLHSNGSPSIKMRCKACSHLMPIRLSNEVPPDLLPHIPRPSLEKKGGISRETDGSVLEGKPGPSYAKRTCKGLSLRTKMFFLFLLTPVLLFICSSAFSQYQMLALANRITAESRDVVAQMAEEIIMNKARSVALQCSIFLRNNPGLSKKDFYSNPGMREIAIQKVGTGGFTTLIEMPTPDQNSDTGYTIWCHSNKAFIGSPLLFRMKEALGLGYPSFDTIFRAMKGGRKIKGYYQGAMDNEKFMAVEPIEETPYLILSTTFIKDFTDPIQLIEKRANRLTRSTQKMSLSFMGGGILFIGLSIMIYGYRLTSDIQQLTDAADRISVGDLGAAVDIHSCDEIGSLADSVNRIQESLRISIDKLRQKNSG